MICYDIYFSIITRKGSLESDANVTTVLCYEMDNCSHVKSVFAYDWVPQRAHHRGFKISTEMEIQMMTVFMGELEKYATFLSYLALDQDTREGFLACLK